MLTVTTCQSIGLQHARQMAPFSILSILLDYENISVKFKLRVFMFVNQSLPFTGR